MMEILIMGALVGVIVLGGSLLLYFETPGRENTMNLMELYFSTSGRINRSTFWVGILGLTVMWLFIFAIGATLWWLGTTLWWFGRAEWLLLIALLVIFIVIFHWNLFAVTVKRLHDRDKSAWWLLLWYAISTLGGAVTFGIASLVVFIWVLVELGFLEGTPGRNRYGEATTQQYIHGRPGIAPQMPGVSPQTPQAGRRMKACPYCAESIMYEAIKCRYCGSDVPKGAPSPTTTARATG